MVSGFDTSEASTYNKTLTNAYKDETKKFYYNVAPAENYEKLNESYIKCFVPTQERGYTKKTTSDDTLLWTKDGVASIEIGCYKQTNITQNVIVNRFNTSGSLIKPNVNVSSYQTQKEISPNVSATYCRFTITGISATFTVLYFDNKVTTSNGSYTQTSQVTVEVLFINYAGTAEAAEMINTVMGSIAK